tara:strand:- start:216 stop:1421 length:1206 start_codon:yes stop_codon:yes gene_type:complete
MAELRQNTWSLDEWYDQAVAGTTGGYQVAKSLYVWGDNTDGQLGQNNVTDRSSPVQIPGTTWSKLGSSSSSYATCYGIKSDGTMWTWGDSLYGLLGNDQDSVDQSSPIQIPGTTWKAAYGGRNLVLASKTDGTIWNWGSNPEGGLGQNNNSSYSSPKQVGTDTTWVGTYAMIACGEGGQAAIKTDGTLWTWGQNYRGELGINNNSHTSSPIQLPGTTWRDVKMGGRFCMATKTNGTLWIWGSNYSGVLGNNTDGDGSSRSSPTQIPGTTWSNCGGVSYSGYAAYAVKTDGTLWAWGYGAYGALGQNETKSYSSPTQIPGTNWEEQASAYVAGAGEPIVFATKTDGTLWSWGTNQGDWKGGLGQNDIINRSSPTQIGTDTNWFTDGGSFTAGGGWGAALKAP